MYKRQEHGGAFTYSLELFGADVGKTPVEVPLDELERYASQPFGVAIAPDKSRVYVTCGGSEIVTVVDVPRLLRFIHAHTGLFAQDLSASANYVVTRIPVGLNPRGLALSRDGRRLFVANRLDDTVSVIDTQMCIRDSTDGSGFAAENSATARVATRDRSAHRRIACRLYCSTPQRLPILQA